MNESGNGRWGERLGGSRDNGFRGTKVVAQYVIDRQLFNHPDFKWVKEHFHWDKKGMQVLQTHSTVSREDQKFKFGAQVPRSPKHALELDRLNGDMGWANSIVAQKERTCPPWSTSCLSNCLKSWYNQELWAYSTKKEKAPSGTLTSTMVPPA